MIIPIGDSPNPPGKPWMTYGLIAANALIFMLLWPQQWQPVDLSAPEVAAYVEALVDAGRLNPRDAGTFAASLSRYDLTLFAFGFRPAAPTLPDAFTAMFLHGGWAHLLGNLLFLWIYGDNVEHRLGRGLFLVAYLATGLAATAGDALIRAGSEVPSVGASGAISGVLGIYALWFPKNRVNLLIFLYFWIDVIQLPARLVLGVYLILDNVLPLLLGGGQGGIAFGAHIGGFVGGLLLAWPLGRMTSSRTMPAGDEERHVLSGAGRPTQRARVRVGETERASRPPTFGEMVGAGRLLEMRGDATRALGLYQRALADHPRAEGRAAAHLGAARIFSGPLVSLSAAQQHLYSALESEPTADEVEEARSLLARIERERGS